MLYIQHLSGLGGNAERYAVGLSPKICVFLRLSWLYIDFLISSWNAITIFSRVESITVTS